MIIEWNAHMFSHNIARYPFHPQAAYIPDASRLLPDPLAAYLAHMKLEGIDRAVIVHPEPYGDDHRLVLDCLAREPERLWGTALFYPKDPDGPQKLKALVQQEPRIIAHRFHAHRGKEMYLDSFYDRGVRALWAASAELNLVVELHIGPNYAAQVSRLVQDYPETPVLIDHLAEPHMGTAVEYAEVLALARFPNVIMKLSGLNHFSDDAPFYQEAKALTRWVIDAFGPEQMVWGSGTPEVVDVHLEHLPEADRAKVKGENLAQLLRRLQKFKG